MKSKQCTYLQDTAEDCLQTSSLDTRQLSLLSGMDMPAKSSENEQQTDGSPTCECGKGTLDCLTHPSTPEAWTAFMQDSLAKTLALLESKQVYLREPDQVFSAKSCASLAWYDQISCSWKTYQQSLATDWEPYLETWPRWGMTAGGSAFVHPMSGRTITEIGGFCWPTPVARDYRSPGRSRMERTGSKAGECLPQMVGGQLNPPWVEWLMGFPVGFTVSKDWVTPKSRSKRQQPIDSSEDK